MLVTTMLLGSAWAHFQLVDNAHGGAIYHNRENAAFISDITRSQSTDRVSTCDHPYLWFEFERPEDFDTLMVGGTVPVIERFEDIRVAAALIGPGLPGSGATPEEIDSVCGYGLEGDTPTGRRCVGLDDLPAEIKAQIPEGMGAVGIPGIPDQTSCWYMEDDLSVRVSDPDRFFGTQYRLSSGGDDVEFATFTDWSSTHCFFHEEWAGSDMWIVQDKLIDLRGEGTHYLVFWAPGDQQIGEPTTTAKFGAVFGDQGQSEDFSGDTQLAGECSLPRQDFYENDCHGYKKPWYYSVFDKIPDFALWGLVGGAPCEPSYAVTMPNLYECPAESEGLRCNTLCHNHGICPAGETPGAPTEGCPTTDDFYDPEGCSETCHWQGCGAGADTLVKGPVGPACKETCRKKWSWGGFKEYCSWPSDECEGIYEEEHSH